MPETQDLRFEEFVEAVKTFDLESVTARETAHSSAVSVKPWQHVESASNDSEDV